MNGAIGITALGMVSSLGREVVTSCAAARAGLTRIRELKCLNVACSAGFGRETLAGMPTLKGHEVPELGFGCRGLAKILALAGGALADLFQRRPLSRVELARSGVFVNLADRYAEDVRAAGAEHVDEEDAAEAPPRPSKRWAEETREFLPRLLARCGVTVPHEQQTLYHGGHAGIAAAARDAVQRILNGAIDRCLVGGVESRVEPQFLEIADALDLLKTNENPVGFIPGEAAAFFLLERCESAAPAALRPQAWLTSAVQAVEKRTQFSEEPPLGQGLEQAIRAACQGSGSGHGPPAFLLGDLNGLERRAWDWGHALVRLRPAVDLGHLPLWLPALSFGETGAATGALAVCLAVRAFERGYAPGGHALVWLASENGARGAITLAAPFLAP